MMDWKWAARNLFRNLRRTVVTMSALIFGFTGLALIGGYLFRVERLIYTQTIYLNQSGHISIYAKNGAEGFSQSPKKFLLKPDQVQAVEEFVRSHQGVEMVGKTLSGVGLVSSGQSSVPFMADGFDEAERSFICNHPLVKEWTPEFRDKGCEQAYTTEDLTMTKNLASSARLSTVQENPNTSIELAARTFDGDLNAVSANLRSFHSTGVALLEDTSLKASNKLLQELFSTDGLWRMQLYLQKDSFIEPLTQALKTQFPDMDVFSFQEQEAGALYIGMMSVLYIIGGFFLVLILGTVLLSLVNSLTISTLERATEIGTLRSMGFSVERISSLFAKESVVLSVGACLLGTVVAVAISSTINALNIRFRPLAAPGDVQFVLTPTWWILIGIAIPLVLVSYIAAQIVTKKLMRQRIVSLLSDSGGRK